jgi:hypothetical protein
VVGAGGFGYVILAIGAIIGAIFGPKGWFYYTTIYVLPAPAILLAISPTLAVAVPADLRWHRTSSRLSRFVRIGTFVAANAGILILSPFFLYYLSLAIYPREPLVFTSSCFIEDKNVDIITSVQNQSGKTVILDSMFVLLGESYDKNYLLEFSMHDIFGELKDDAVFESGTTKKFRLVLTSQSDWQIPSGATKCSISEKTPFHVGEPPETVADVTVKALH